MHKVNMGEFINSDIIFVGAKPTISKLRTYMEERLANNDIISVNSIGTTRLCVGTETRSEAPEAWIKSVKDKFKLKAAFMLGFDHDSYEVAYYKEIDGKNMDCEQMFRGISDDDDNVYLEQEHIVDSIEEKFLAYIREYLKN